MLKSLKCGVTVLLFVLTSSACTSGAQKNTTKASLSGAVQSKTAVQSKPVAQSKPTVQAKPESLFGNKIKNPIPKQAVDKIDVTMQANRADQFYQNGDFSSAETEYQKLLKLDQKQPVAYYRLGNIAFRNKQLKRAIFYFNKSVEMSPRNDKAQYNLAMTYLSLAEQHLKLYTNMVPNEADSVQVNRMLAEIEFFSQNDGATASKTTFGNAGQSTADELTDQSILDELAKELE